MQACCAQIKFSSTDDGFKIEVSGKEAKEMMAKCKEMFSSCCDGTKEECCPPAEKKS